MRRPALTWLVVILATAVAGCGSDNRSPTPSTAALIASASPASASASLAPSASRPATSPTPDVSSPAPTSSPGIPPGAGLFEVNSPIVGFHSRTGVGSAVPVTIGLVLGPAGSDPMGPSTSVAIASSRDGGPFTELTLRDSQIRELNNPGITGIGPYLPAGPGEWWETYRTLVPTENYQFRARIRDPGTQAWGPWVVGPTLAVHVLQETSLVFQYSAGWSRTTGAALLGGGSETATSVGEVATATISARSIAWVALRRPEGGSAEVRIDGVLAATVNLYQTVFPDLTTPEIVFAQTWPESGPHTISITVVGTADNSVVNIDEVLVIS